MTIEQMATNVIDRSEYFKNVSNTTRQELLKLGVELLEMGWKDGYWDRQIDSNLMMKACMENKISVASILK